MAAEILLLTTIYLQVIRGSAQGQRHDESMSGLKCLKGGDTLALKIRKNTLHLSSGLLPNTFGEGGVAQTTTAWMPALVLTPLLRIRDTGQSVFANALT
jgi:hypothetical protein